MMHVFPETGIDRLGFSVILEKISDYLKTDQGRVALSNLTLSASIEEVRRKLSITYEVQTAQEFDDPVPHSDVADIFPYLDRLGPEGVFLDGEELLEIRALVITISALQKYYSSRSAKYPDTFSLFEEIFLDTSVPDELGRCLEPDGSVSASASPELRRVRKEKESAERSLQRVLAREFSKAGAAGHAAEGQPTIRAGRHVIPVRVEAKRKVNGFVHDVSSSGLTVFVEPAACLDLNNEIRTLEAKERTEIIKVLTRLTHLVRTNKTALSRASNAIGEYDLHHAMAVVSRSISGVVPVIREEPGFKIVGGRNPALALFFVRSSEDRSVVPMDLEMFDDNRTIIVSGPNAGGKTVALKTLGLCVLMLAVGMPVPADASSEFSIPTKLFVDIGDDQSLEEDLSSYSSHLSRMKKALDTADANSLVLVDEIGAATDPDQGSAIALAMLQQLTDKGCMTFVTTHFGRLKAAAESHQYFCNASMEFDTDELAPTYRFEQGLPGSSYAMEIAGRVGLNSDVVESARMILGDQEYTVEELIVKLERSQRESDQLRIRLDAELRAATATRKELDSKLAKHKEDAASIRYKAVAESQKLLRESRARIENTIREIREAEAEKKATRAARSELEAFAERVEKTRQDQSSGAPAVRTGEHESISVGDRVVIDDGSTSGEVLEVKKGRVTVAAGTGKVTVKQERVRKVGGKQEQQVHIRTTSSTTGAIRPAARIRIDVRGNRVEEALSSVVPFVDDAVAAGLDEISILHGTGTGALRNAIREYLQTRRDVTSVGDADWESGGPGVTVIRLD
ncbi:MAG: endonuclease MutS2 [Rhodothermales bacterium]|nr:endonuclease MutS2 [Rhodothermales bacterium]